MCNDYFMYILGDRNLTFDKQIACWTQEEDEIWYILCLRKVDMGATLAYNNCTFEPHSVADTMSSPDWQMYMERKCTNDIGRVSCHGCTYHLAQHTLRFGDTRSPLDSIQREWQIKAWYTRPRITLQSTIRNTKHRKVVMLKNCHKKQICITPIIKWTKPSKQAHQEDRSLECLPMASPQSKQI